MQGHVEWDNVPYAPGTLQAIGYNNGVAVSDQHDHHDRRRLPKSPWCRTGARFWPMARDVSVVTVEVLDAQGNVVPTATK